MASPRSSFGVGPGPASCRAARKTLRCGKSFAFDKKISLRGGALRPNVISPQSPPSVYQGPSVYLPNLPVHNTAKDTLKEVNPEDMVLAEGELGAVTRPMATAQDAERLNWYLRAILTANVYDVAVESALDYAPRLSERIGARIHLKREDLQPVFSFKLRGAYNRMVNISPEQRKKGVICSSAGNHAQGVALAARELGCDAVICMPITTPAIKIEAVKRLGATVALEGENYDACQAYAKKRGVDEGRTFVPPFDDPLIVAGQGTIGMEIVRQLPSVEYVFVPVGGGGLISGIAAYVKSIRPDVKVIGVEPEGANAMAQSLFHGEICRLAKVDPFADGVAVKQVGEVCFDLCQQLVDGVMTVKTDQICAAIKDVFTENRSILEPAGAVAVAGAKAYCQLHGITGDVVAVTSGANMNFDRLRIVSQLADGGLKQEATLVSSIPETNGSFKTFVELMGGANFTEFKYRVSDNNQQAVVLYSVTVNDDSELQASVDRLNNQGFFTENLTDDETTQVHLRHMVGGSANVVDERIYKVEIPERAGALETFLNAVSPAFQITMTHYRSDGGQVGNTLFGLKVGAGEIAALETAMKSTGYVFVDMTSNAAYNMLYGCQRVGACAVDFAEHKA